jgi:hypothetical protein
MEEEQAQAAGVDQERGGKDGGVLKSTYHRVEWIELVELVSKDIEPRSSEAGVHFCA